MLFLGNLVDEGNYNAVGFIHYLPFDRQHGIKHEDTGVLYTVEELSTIGVLVDSLPEEVVPEGKYTKGLYIDKTTNAVTYLYEDIPQKGA